MRISIMERFDRNDVTRHIAGLRRYARMLLRDDGAADDLVQETLLRAIERAGTFRTGAPVKPWLMAILHNLFVTGRRRRAAETRRDESYQDLYRTAHEPEDPVIAAELANVAARFAALPDPQRAVLHLIGVEGLSYQEAADTLAVPIGTVMSRLSRARATLRDADATATSRPRLRIVGRDEHD